MSSNKAYDPAKTRLVRHVYYSNCRLNGRTSVLAGPFEEASQAEASLDSVAPVCVNYRPETSKASFGVLRVRAPGLGGGIYNDILPESLKGELLIDTGTRH